MHDWVTGWRRWTNRLHASPLHFTIITRSSTTSITSFFNRLVELQIMIFCRWINAWELKRLLYQCHSLKGITSAGYWWWTSRQGKRATRRKSRIRSPSNIALCTTQHLLFLLFTPANYLPASKSVSKVSSIHFPDKMENVYKITFSAKTDTHQQAKKANIDENGSALCINDCCSCCKKITEK